MVPTLSDALLEAALKWLARQLSPYLPPARAARFSVAVTREVQGPMGKTFAVTATLPPLPAPNDIKTQELTVTADGKPQPPLTLDPTATTADLGQFPEGASLSVALVYIDDSPNANRSEPRVETLAVSDTVAPAQPGDFSFKVDQVLTPSPA